MSDSKILKTASPARAERRRRLIALWLAQTALGALRLGAGTSELAMLAALADTLRNQAAR